jgi:hypothetical protein
MPAPSTYLDEVRMSTALVGLLLQQIGAPQEPFRTPPWMSRRFADSLVQARSAEDISALVARDTHDAAAFVMTAFHVIRDMETGECVLQRPQHATELTAAGHAVISFLDEVERVYPEGLTKYDEAI